MAANVTRAQKQAIARKLIDQAGTLVEFWDEYRRDDPALDGVESNQAAEILGQWLARLPGESWSCFLTEPER